MKLQLKRKAEPVVMPNWHPDFRNASILPDLKVVRTSFFLNLVCSTVAAVALLATAFREYTAMSIRHDIQAAEARIAETQRANSQFLALNREFADASRKFSEASKFLDQGLKASEILVALSASLPASMDFTTVAFDGRQLTLRGTIRGLSETASTRLSAYLDVLRGDAVLGPRFSDVSLTNLLRDPNTQGLSFEIQMRPASAKSAKANKA